MFRKTPQSVSCARISSVLKEKACDTPMRQYLYCLFGWPYNIRNVYVVVSCVHHVILYVMVLYTEWKLRSKNIQLSVDKRFIAARFVSLRHQRRYSVLGRRWANGGAIRANRIIRITRLQRLRARLIITQANTYNYCCCFFYVKGIWESASIQGQ